MGQKSIGEFWAVAGSSWEIFWGEDQKGKGKRKEGKPAEGDWVFGKRRQRASNKAWGFFLEKSRRRKGAPSGMDYYF